MELQEYNNRLNEQLRKINEDNVNGLVRAAAIESKDES